MEEGLAAMKTALRVLSAISEGLQPEPADVHAVQNYAGPQPEGAGLDEVACAAVQRALTRRAKIRIVTRTARV
jgi:hypothetical protein